MYVLGLSAYYHDSAAALIKDGEIIAAAQEERFTRKKHDPAFPAEAIKYCLKEAGISLSEVSAVTFYDKPLLKFERLLETYFSYAPRGFVSFVQAMPIWLKEKLFLKSILKKELLKIAPKLKSRALPQILFAEHHQSHAASAFYPSPFQHAAVLCLDGVGEWASTSVWLGNGAKLEAKWEVHFPHSLGLLYSAFTYFTGFRVNSGEYKLMGLAPYGRPIFKDLIFEKLVDLKEDGSFRLNMDYFDFATGLKMTNSKFAGLFGGPPRKPEEALTQREMDLASSIQAVTEEVVLRLAKGIHQEFGVDSICLAGGVALNCVVNGRLLREGPFKHVWIQPAAGDAGGAIGAALSTWHQYFGHPRKAKKQDLMRGSYLGPELDDEQIERELRMAGAVFERLGELELFRKSAELLEGENVLGWVQGRMEFGPRALGNRSIIGDPRSRKMQSIMNLKIKYRESFRPFAPAVLEHEVSDYFELDRESPYMLLVAPLKKSLQIPMSAQDEGLFGIDKLNVVRSTLPSVTHVDYSARVQTVSSKTNSRFHGLLTEFKCRTGCGVLVNTSFNVRGEPIVATAADAFRCFMRTEMDYLVVGNYLLDKKLQAAVASDSDWKKEFALD